MPPRKRAAEDDGATGPTTRSAKAPKTEQPSPAKGRGGGRGRKGPKTNIAASAFKARALPLHVNITHTPPVLADDGTITLASADPGFIGTTTLVPSTFATGSYGWKGSKRLTIELQNPEGDDEKEKVHVMLTINATVMGSKGAKEEAEAEGEADAEGETKEEGGEEGAEAAEEDAEKTVEQAVAEEPKGTDEGGQQETKEANGEASGETPMEDVKDGE
ncbi:hypothetical protein BD414DRAFT_476968 [Trametes punicea]|nr:hypothetical protein BD414DRAFT_476968 [Trametes punicea]